MAIAATTIVLPSDNLAKSLQLIWRVSVDEILEILLTYVPKDPTDKSATVQKMACYPTGFKPLADTMIRKFT